MLDNLVQKSLEHSAEKPGDYIKDGVLCCGACGKPKQKKIHFPSIGDRLVGSPVTARNRKRPRGRCERYCRL